MSTSSKSRGDHFKHTKVEGSPRPKNLTFMVGCLVFLGFYQIFLARKFGSSFEGKKGDLRHYFGAGTVEPLYIAIGVLALVVAWGGWRLRPWAYHLAWVFQELMFAVVLTGIGLRIAGKPAPLAWLLLDIAFGAYNVWWLLQPETRRAFVKPKADSDPRRRPRVQLGSAGKGTTTLDLRDPTPDWRQLTACSRQFG